LKTIGSIFLGHTEVGIAVRDGFIKCEDYACITDHMANVRLITPVFFIIAGTEKNEGMVMSRWMDSVANIRTLADNWYVFQTNDDHFDGVCQERCQDGIAHLEALGQANLTPETLLNEVMLKSHTFSDKTIYTTMIVPSKNQFACYPEDTDMPYVAMAAPAFLQ